MALPILDNHDERIRFYELMLEADITAIGEIPLPAGYRYAFYQEGDRDAWIEIESSAREFSSYDQGLEAWKRFYAQHTDELKARMVFIENEGGEKVATATAYYDIRGLDQSGAGWLHWVAVRREDQGKGLSKPLVSHVIQVMKSLGYTHAKIPTQTTTWVACKVYLDLGFRPIEKNLIRCRDGWRIIKRLTHHPALDFLDAAADDEVLTLSFAVMARELTRMLKDDHPQAENAPASPYWRVRIANAKGREMEMQLDDNYTLLFGDWHVHCQVYSADGHLLARDSFEEMKRIIQDLLSGKTFIYTLETSESRLGGGSCQAGPDLKRALRDEFLQWGFLEKAFKEKEITAHCRFWDHNRDCDLIFSPADWADGKE